VRHLERLGDGDGCDASAASAAAKATASATSCATDCSDNRCLLIRTTINRNRLAGAISVAVLTIVPPGVPTVAMTAVSRFAPVSITIVWPTLKSTLLTLMLFAPTTESAERVEAVCKWKSPQLLSVSAPSGKRPALLLVALTV
jgi:hypothetical protein